MKIEREQVTKQLKDMSAYLTSRDYDPYYTPPKEDVKLAKYYHNLAKKNELGTLSAKEAQKVLEVFDPQGAIINDTKDGHRWVELVNNTVNASKRGGLIK